MGNIQGNIQDNEPVTIPYVVFRDLQTHNRWVVKGLVVALVITIILLFASNTVWLVFWNQYDLTTEDTVTTVDSEGDGIANYVEGDVIGNGGVIIGEGDGTKEGNNTN